MHHARRSLKLHVRSQNRQAIQVLEEARDAIQTLHVGPTFIISGSVDGHVRTYDLRMGELRSDFIGRRFKLYFDQCCIQQILSLDPVTSVVPTNDAQTLLVASLDNHIRLMDASNGKMLNDFTGHANDSYRCRACFGHGEATVVSGDENGQVWAWDLLDVSSRFFSPFIVLISRLLHFDRHRYCSQIRHQKFTTSLSPGRSITQRNQAK